MRKLATWAGSFAVGTFVAQYFLPFHWLLAAGFAVLVAGELTLFLREPFRFRAVLICTAVSTALGYNWLYAFVVQLPAETLADSGQSQVTMTLCEYPTATAYGAKVTVLPNINGLHGVRAAYYGDAELLKLTPGCTVTDDIYLKSAARIQEDEVTSFTSKGVFLLAYSRGIPISDCAQADSMRWWPLRMGRAMQEKIADLYSGDTAGFLSAILTGDPTKIPEAAGIDLSEAGIYHIMAVSGLHCSFLLALIVLLTGRQRRHLTVCVAIPVLLFYALLTGARPSVVRACVMLIMLLLAPMLRREGDPPTALSVALLLILVQNPFAAASISLQLSFGAVAGMLWLTPKMERYLLGGEQRGKVWRLIAASVSATCGALVLTLPLTVYYFHLLVLVAPLSNLLCLWAVSGAFATGLISVLLGFISVPLGAIVAWIPKGLTQYILFTVHGLAKIPYHALYDTNPFLKYWLIYFYILFGTAYFCKRQMRRKYVVAAVLAGLSLIATVKLGERYLSYGALDIVEVDVGQGACTVMASGGQFALMDCGSANSWKGAGSDAADQLLSMGCKEINYLVVSHYDYDHVSGISALMNRVSVKTLLVPDVQDDDDLRDWVLSTARKYGADIEFVTQKKDCPLGNSVLTVFPPFENNKDNDQGLSLLCTEGNFDLLITGDMTAKTEDKLANTTGLKDVEAFIVSHHGSKYSTGEDLLNALKPEIGIISVGRNSYGHPAEQVLWRLEDVGTTVYRTDKQGSIHITVR